MAVTSAVLALIIEAALRHPPALMRTALHPVTWIGALIDTLERRFNQPKTSARVRQSLGLTVLAAVIIVAAAPAFAVERMLLLLPFGTLAVALLASTLLAQR